jgi:hypothetical protein
MGNLRYKIENPKSKFQTNSKSKIQSPKTDFGDWDLVIGYCLVIVSWLLVISPTSCGEFPSELASIIVSPSSSTIGVNKTAQFSALGKDSGGNIVTNFTPTWSVEGGIGSIYSSSGSYAVFQAGWVEGSGYVVASYGSVEGRAKVTVTAKGWLTGVIRTPELGYARGIIVELKENPSLMDDTDEKGEYLISNIPPGTYEARTRENELYLSASSEVTIGSGETVTWTTTLTYKPGIPTVPTTTLFVP